MRWIRTIALELFGLFVDEGRFALAILAWVAAVGLVLPRAGISPQWRAPLLFLGLAAILLEGALRRARR